VRINSSRSTYAGRRKSTNPLTPGKTWADEWALASFLSHIGSIQIHSYHRTWFGLAPWVAYILKTKEAWDSINLQMVGSLGKRTLYMMDHTGIIDIKIHPTKSGCFFWLLSWERFRQATNDFIGNGKGSSIWRSERWWNTWKRQWRGFFQKMKFTEESALILAKYPDVVYAYRQSS